MISFTADTAVKNDLTPIGGEAYKVGLFLCLSNPHFKRRVSMNKADLIERVAKDAGITKSQAETAISSLLAGIEGDLKKGGRVTLVGFGTFSVGSRKARTGRNPRTGQPLKIAARKVAKFSPGAELKAAVNRKK